MERSKVYFAIDTERTHQDQKWGAIDKHPHEVGAWLTIMRSILTKAEHAWMTQAGDHGALEEIRQVLAVGVACCEQHGIQTRSKFLEPTELVPGPDTPRTTPQPTKRTCGDCGYFDATGSGELIYNGYCGRYPPQVVRGEEQVDTVWPSVTVYMFCGEWKERS